MAAETPETLTGTPPRSKWARAACATYSALLCARKAVGEVWRFAARIGDRLTPIAIALGKAAGVVLVTLFIVTVLEDAFGYTYQIEMISVPEEFAKSIGDKEAITYLLQAEISKLAAKASASQSIRASANDASEPAIMVVGTDLPIHYAANLLRSTFGTTYARISGSLVVSPEAALRQDPSEQVSSSGAAGADRASKASIVRLVLRDDATGAPIFDESGELQALLPRAAQAALQVIDPFTAASYLDRGPVSQKKEALSLASVALATTRTEEAVSWRRWFGSWLFTDRVPHGYMTNGLILLSLGERDAAIDAFRSAASAYRERHPFESGWYVASDAIGYAYMTSSATGANTDPGSYFEQSLELEPDYDSALFHRAELVSKDALAHLSDGSKPVLCADIQAVFAADRGFDGVIKRYPHFAIAYHKQAILLFTAARRLRDWDGKDCPNLQSEAEVRSKAASWEEKTETLFHEAIQTDPDYGDAWLQLGILRVERQMPGLRPPSEAALTMNDRRVILDDAISDFRRATQIIPNDQYIWRRLGEALRDRGDLSSPAEKPRYVDLARIALCRSVSLIDKDSYPADWSTSFNEAKNLVSSKVDLPCP
ncbi:MAG TPA: hypothetical protein VKS60_07420 [Stellaceae bacterium]|nr:hypothetical protein [Stellaceae bacterium]